MLLLASNYFDLLAIVVHGTFSFSFKFKYSDRARSTIHITNAGMLGHKWWPHSKEVESNRNGKL